MTDQEIIERLRRLCSDADVVQAFFHTSPLKLTSAMRHTVQLHAGLLASDLQDLLSEMEEA